MSQSGRNGVAALVIRGAKKIERIFMVRQYIDKYINHLQEQLRCIDFDAVEKIIRVLEETIINKSRIYVVGNGGSAATASHMVNDLGVGLRRRGIRNFDIISLTDNNAVCTAAANDIGYENIFTAQIQGLLKPADVLIAISCSGNSENVSNVALYAKEIGSTVVGVTGFDGGILLNVSDISFHVDSPKGEYGLVEDIHMILDHMIYSYYIDLEKGK